MYDVEKSAYVTLDDLEAMVLSGEAFRVHTTRGEDITAQILFNILLNGNNAGKFIFSEQNLRNLITFVNGPMLGSVRGFFEQSLPMFAQMQNDLKEKYGGSFSSPELEKLITLQMNFLPKLMEQYMERSMDNYLATQKNLQTMMGMPTLSLTDIFNPLAAKPPKDKSEK